MTIQHVCCNVEGDTAETRLNETLFCVEATSFERFTLWSRWCAESQETWEPLFEKWEQLGGWLVTVGELDGRPVCVSMDWVRMDGHLIMFWDAVSQVTDSLQVEAWFKKHFDKSWGGGRRAMTDASNFHFVEAAIAEARDQPAFHASRHEAVRLETERREARHPSGRPSEFLGEFIEPDQRVRGEASNKVIADDVQEHTGPKISLDDRRRMGDPY